MEKDKMIIELKERLPYMSEKKLKELIKQTKEKSDEDVAEDIRAASKGLK